jgi:hypothetical protein
MRNLTRETKAGIVVSVVFLSLVGVVVAAKMREPEPARGDDEETRVAAGKKAPEPPDVNIRGPAPEVPEPKMTPLPVKEIPLPDLPEPKGMPLPEPKGTLLPEPPGTPLPDVPEPKGTPLPEPKGTPLPDVPEPKGNPLPDVPEPKGTPLPEPRGTPLPDVPEPKGTPLPEPKGTPLPDVPEPKGTPLPDVSEPRGTQPSEPSATGADDRGTRRTRFTPATAGRDTATPSVKVPEPVDAPPPIPAPGQPPREGVKPAGMQGEPVRALPDVGTPRPADGGVPPVPAPGEPQSLPGTPGHPPKTADIRVDPPSPTAVDVQPPTPASGGAAIPPIPAPPTHLTGEPLPPLKEPDKAAGTPLPSLPAPTGPKPKVDVIKQWVHAVQPGDSYATVSKQVYGTDRYALALQQYNEKEYSAPKGQLPDKVRLPAAAVLEQKYPSFIGGGTPGGIQQTGFVPK